MQRERQCTPHTATATPQSAASAGSTIERRDLLSGIAIIDSRHRVASPYDCSTLQPHEQHSPLSRPCSVTSCSSPCSTAASQSSGKPPPLELPAATATGLTLRDPLQRPIVHTPLWPLRLRAVFESALAVCVSRVSRPPTSAVATLSLLPPLSIHSIVRSQRPH